MVWPQSIYTHFDVCFVTIFGTKSIEEIWIFQKDADGPHELTAFLCLPNQSILAIYDCTIQRSAELKVGC